MLNLLGIGILHMWNQLLKKILKLPMNLYHVAIKVLRVMMPLKFSKII
jgi:hypothetical protein